eukprot:TRINITY_DN3286_c0_g1_i1.p1 TRINITY_DN3286_c0_g1~~TRINITY_DN3286_c0_g1_i1.p1  ORF type:complete len:502 (-),score=146.34 TRINITY_DN3286_c0_g1_i1:116-1621(-)
MCVGIWQTRICAATLVGASPTAPCPWLPSPVALPTPLPTPISDAFDQLQMLLPAWLKGNSTAPGLYVAVTYGQQVVWEAGFGSKNLSDPGVPPDADTIFRIGSGTKMFAVFMLYQLWERGLLALDDPVTKFAPAFSIRPPYNSEASIDVTFKQLACHLAGLPREAPCGFPCNLTTDEAFEYVADMVQISPPWTMPSYSNLGFALLGNILAEFVAEQRFEDYVGDNILEPLGMLSSGFEFTDDVISRMAVGYNPDGSVAELIDLGWERPAGQMYSSGADLAGLVMALNSASQNVDNAMLSAESTTEMLQSLFENPDGATSIGTPWESVQVSGAVCRRKGGNINGFTSLTGVVPDLTLGLVILWNGGANEFDWSTAVLNLLVPAFIEALGPLQPGPPQPPQPQQFVGNFISPADGSAGTVAIVSGQLQLTMQGSILPLSWLDTTEPDSQVFQLTVPPGVLSCLATELEAISNQYVVFGLGPDGSVVNLTLPGLAWGEVWLRQD